MENRIFKESRSFINNDSAQSFLLLLKNLLEKNYKDDDLVTSLFLLIYGVTNKNNEYAKLDVRDLKLICENLQISEDLFQLPSLQKPEDIFISIKQNSDAIVRTLRQNLTNEKLEKLNDFLS